MLHCNPCCRFQSRYARHHLKYHVHDVAIIVKFLSNTRNQGLGNYLNKNHREILDKGTQKPGFQYYLIDWCLILILFNVYFRSISFISRRSIVWLLSFIEIDEIYVGLANVSGSTNMQMHQRKQSFWTNNSPLSLLRKTARAPSQTWALVRHQMHRIW